MSNSSQNPARTDYSRIIVGLRKELRNWWWLLPIAVVVLPSRFPPRAGMLSTPLARKIFVAAFKDGMRMSCRLGEFFSIIEVFGLRIYEVPQIDYLNAEIVVDVGANVGAASLWFLAKSPRCQVISVEPDFEVAALLKKNCMVNHLDDRMTIIHAGVSSHSGEGYLEAGVTSTTNRIVAIGDTESGTDSHLVPLVSLHDLLISQQLERIDILKLDCEGAEFDIICNAATADLEKVGAVIGEFHCAFGSPIDLEVALTRSGFSFRVLFSEEDSVNRAGYSGD